jgi:hypothetical protein
MDESKFRGTVLSALKPLHGVFVENSMRAGTPDINYVEGWLELKWLPSWPVRAKTPIALPKFTSQQRVFLVNRARSNGQARFLLRVGKEWILLNGFWSAVRLGKGATRAEILSVAEKHWPSRLDGSALVDHLRNPPSQDIARWSSLLESVVI